MAKKVAVDLGANFSVKMADGKKSKANKPDRLVIESPVIIVDNLDFNPAKPASKTNPKEIPMPLVDKCISMSQAIENLCTELKMHEATLIDAASTAKTKAADADDMFVKTLDISGSSLKIQVQFRDAYSKMDISMEAPLRKVFGDKFDLMYTKVVDHSIRDGKLADLKTRLGDDFELYFNTDESLKPTTDFQQTFFQLRKNFKPDQLEVVEKVKAATQSKPAIKYPK